MTHVATQGLHAATLGATNHSNKRMRGWLLELKASITQIRYRRLALYTLAADQPDHLAQSDGLLRHV